MNVTELVQKIQSMPNHMMCIAQFPSMEKAAATLAKLSFVRTDSSGIHLPKHVLAAVLRQDNSVVIGGTLSSEERDEILALFGKEGTISRIMPDPEEEERYVADLPGKIMEMPNATMIIATFPSMEKATATLGQLSFVSADAKGMHLPKHILATITKKDNGVVIGGTLSSHERDEILRLFRKAGTIVQIRPSLGGADEGGRARVAGTAWSGCAGPTDLRDVADRITAMPNPTLCYASFPSVDKAAETVGKLSFVSVDAGGIALPKHVVCGIAPSDVGASVVFGGSLSEQERTEVFGLFKKEGRIEMMAPAPGEPKASRRSGDVLLKVDGKEVPTSRKGKKWWQV